jgi:hypothetical protein
MPVQAWKLLLEQMKEVDAAQASNLGQALGPAIAGRLQELTRRRYETVQLTAQLATEGIMVSGAVKPTEQISVGTREQLSTLYRLSLAEYRSERLNVLPCTAARARELDTHRSVPPRVWD